jgi:hypothetical protein
MITDRISEDADWKDGINQFRAWTTREIDLINKKLEKLEQQTKEKTP